MPEKEGWVMCLKRAVSKILLGKKTVEAKELRDKDVAERVAVLRARVNKSEKDSLEVTQEIKDLVSARQSSSDWSRESD